MPCIAIDTSISNFNSFHVLKYAILKKGTFYGSGRFNEQGGGDGCGCWGVRVFFNLLNKINITLIVIYIFIFKN